MKTLKLKKIVTLSSIVVLMLVSSPMFSQTNPTGSGDTNDEGEAPAAVPIDQNILLGLVVGCMIGAYFFVGKQKNALTK